MMTDHARRATNVCETCKLRKKRCDKAIPTCGYCTRHKLICRYTTFAPSTGSSRSLLSSDNLHKNTSNWHGSIYDETYRLIRATGRFFDDVTVSYFDGLHHLVPFISRERLHQELYSSGSTNKGDFHLLLLVLGLITYRPPRANSEKIDLLSLYLNVRSLYQQTLALCEPSLHLVQAGLLISIFEYGHRKPDLALGTLSSCARMAYAVGLDRDEFEGQNPELAEKTDTWWGIVICERIFLCDARNPTQPRVSLISADDTPLPGETIRTPLCSTTTPNLSGFGRIAQAAWLLDRVLNIILLPDNKAEWDQLNDLDIQLQSLLSLMLQSREREDDASAYCGALALGLRALFILHSHILHPLWRAVTNSTGLPRGEDLIHRSNAALATATRMVVDIAVSHQQLLDREIDVLPPSCSYLMQEALKHLDGTNPLIVERSIRSLDDRQIIVEALDLVTQNWNMQWGPS